MPAAKGRELYAFRLSPVARKLLVKLAKASGISMTAALEIAIREAAKKRGVE